MSAGDGIDPGDLEVCLRVIAELDGLPVEHPDAIAVQRATSSLYKTVKLRRRSARRDAILSADRAVTEATATAAPGRIDDETRGLPLAPRSPGRSAGTLLQPRACYVCKRRYTRGRRLLPPALSRLRGAATTASGRPAPT